MMGFYTTYEWHNGCLAEIPFEALRPGMIAVMEESDGSKMGPFFLVTGTPRPRPDSLVPGNWEVESKVLTI